jgi:hypothetical protein
MAGDKAIILDYSLILTETRSRRAMTTNRMIALSGDNFELRDLTIIAGEQLTLMGITTFLLIKSTAPLQININNLGFVQFNSIYVQDGPLGNVTLFNSSTTAINCFICNS